MRVAVLFSTIASAASQTVKTTNTMRVAVLFSIIASAASQTVKTTNTGYAILFLV
jgi:hypothetical protein